MGRTAYARSLDASYHPANPSAVDSSSAAREIVRYATMAPNSHNTQPWTFELRDSVLVIRPDFTRRCPTVDPDDHHLFVSLGCAVENAVLAAEAFGIAAVPEFDEARDEIHIALRPALGPADSPTSHLFESIPLRQSTRATFDGSPLGAGELDSLDRAAAHPGVSVLFFTEAEQIEAILDYVIEGNTAQVENPAFVSELDSWIRSSYSSATGKADGLFSRSCGQPAAPDWIGHAIFKAVFKVGPESKKLRKQVRSSAGIAIFVGADESHASWVEVGRSFERFALQATSMGILHAHINQPVEVAEVRPRLAERLGIAPQRPDLVVRFGRGATLPKSLRRPLSDVVHVCP